MQARLDFSGRLAFLGGGHMARALAGGLIARGFEPVGSSAAEFAAVLRSDIETWRPVIRKAGLKND